MGRITSLRLRVVGTTSRGIKKYMKGDIEINLGFTDW
jgi:hypothetical protein